MDSLPVPFTSQALLSMPPPLLWRHNPPVLGEDG